MGSSGPLSYPRPPRSGCGLQSSETGPAEPPPASAADDPPPSLPPAQGQAPLNQHRSTFPRVLLTNLCQVPPDRHVHETGRRWIRTVRSRSDPRHGQSQVGDRCSLGCRSQVRVTGEVPGQDHGVHDHASCRTPFLGRSWVSQQLPNLRVHNLHFFREGVGKYDVVHGGKLHSAVLMRVRVVEKAFLMGRMQTGASSSLRREQRLCCMRFTMQVRPCRLRRR